MSVNAVILSTNKWVINCENYWLTQKETRNHFFVVTPLFLFMRKCKHVFFSFLGIISCLTDKSWGEPGAHWWHHWFRGLCSQVWVSSSDSPQCVSSKYKQACGSCLSDELKKVWFKHSQYWEYYCLIHLSPQSSATWWESLTRPLSTGYWLRCWETHWVRTGAWFNLNSALSKTCVGTIPYTTKHQ